MANEAYRVGSNQCTGELSLDDDAKQEPVGKTVSNSPSQLSKAPDAMGCFSNSSSHHAECLSVSLLLWQPLRMLSLPLLPSMRNVNLLSTHRYGK